MLATELRMGKVGSKGVPVRRRAPRAWGRLPGTPRPRHSPALEHCMAPVCPQGGRQALNMTQRPPVSGPANLTSCHRPGGYRRIELSRFLHSTERSLWILGQALNSAFSFLPSHPLFILECKQGSLLQQASSQSPPSTHQGPLLLFRPQHGPGVSGGRAGSTGPLGTQRWLPTSLCGAGGVLVSGDFLEEDMSELRPELQQDW